MRRNIRNSEGFTVIELSLVLLIFGLMSGTVLLGLKLYNAETIRAQTEEAVEIDQLAFLEFSGEENRYPCPANPALGPDDVGYGREDCGLTPVPGQRDMDGDGNMDPVLIGAIPFLTMLDPDNDGDFDNDGVTDTPLTEAMTIDGWGNKLTYAVSALLVVPATFGQGKGVIEVVDENDLSVLGLPNSADYIIVSAGPNGEGAYSREGERIGTCSTSVPIDGNPGDPPKEVNVNETENCNGDSTFINGLHSEHERYYNDDALAIGIATNASHWKFVDPTIDEELRITNTNAGNVGVGVDDPVERYHVEGDLKADQIQAEEFCDPTDYDTVNSACMPTEVIAGTDPNMNCDATAGTAVTAIEQNAVTSHCARVFPQAGSLPAGFQTTCPIPGEAIVGFSNISGVICEPRS